MSKYHKFLLLIICPLIASCSNDNPLYVTFDQIQGQWEVEEGTYKGTTFYLYPDSIYMLSTQFKTEAGHGHETIRGKSIINNTTIQLLSGNRKHSIIFINDYEDEVATINMTGDIQVKGIKAFRKYRNLEH
ncbi:MAG: hypothetical protein WCS17_11970 [Prevotella sp.]